MTTRREFIKKSAILAAGTLIIPDRFNINIKSKPRVIILGAGLSGLSAAYALSKKNFEVTVLEARNRIGGRVFSHQIDKEDSLIVELGGEWVGASHERIAELCQEFELELQNNQFDTHLTYAGKYYPYGKWSYTPEWQNKYSSLIDGFPGLTEKEKMELDKIDWWRFLMNNGIPERDLEIKELFDSTDFGESARHFSAFSALHEYAESSEKNEMDYQIKGGNGKLAEKLAEKIGRNNVKLNHKVIEISQTDGIVTVDCQNGSRFECDKVVCSIPTYSMSKISWKPSLPQEKLDAVNQLQYARINKNVFLFDERFWKDESFDMVTDVYGHYFYHATKNQKSNKGALISYTIGDKADVIHRQNKEFKKEVAVNSLRQAFGDISDKILKQVNYYWGIDGYSKGAYAFYGKGQWFTIMPALKSPFLNVHFAGEHLADWQGFMEGAVNSGEEAAEEIIG